MCVCGCWVGCYLWLMLLFSLMIMPDSASAPVRSKSTRRGEKREDPNSSCEYSCIEVVLSAGSYLKIKVSCSLLDCFPVPPRQQGLGSKCTRVCRMHPLRTAVFHHVSVHDLSSCSLPLTSKHRSATRFASHKFVPLSLRGAHVVVVLFNKLQQRRSQWLF